MNKLFYGNITEESLKFVNKSNVFTKYFDRYANKNYPDILDSSEEIAELISMRKLAESKSNWNNVKKFLLLCDGSMDDTFKVYLKKMRIPFTQAYINKLVEISHTLGCLIMDLKVHYQRPRPFQVAYYTRQNLHPMTTLSGQSPAFPSGHATQGRFLTKVITQDNPSKRIELSKLSEKISESRLLMGVHYPSDNLFGEKIANDLWKEKEVQNYLDSFE